LIATAARGGSRFRGRGARFCGHPGAHDNWVVQRVRGRCEVPDCTCRHYVPDTDKARPANCLIGLLRKRTKRAALNAAPLAQPIYLTNTVADRGTAEPSVMPPASREPPRNCHESVRYRNSHYIFVRQLGAVATDNWANNMIPTVRRSCPELAGLSDDEVLSRISAELTPVGRAGSAREIAAIAAFLGSARNGFVTGDTIEASGGADRFM
jgi:hypothetical protein